MNYIILVNWNGARDLLECLESILRLKDDNHCVLVCDNGSSDSSLDKLSEWAAGRLDVDVSTEAWRQVPGPRLRQPRLILDAGTAAPRERHAIYWLPLGRNAGFAAANNHGLRFAFEDDGAEFAWLLNSDTIAAPDSLSELLARASETDQPGLVGSTLCFYYRPDQVQALGVHYDLNSHRGVEIHRGGSAYALPERSQVEQRMTYVVGASMLVSRAFFETVGPMEESYFLYFEELDWAVRARGVHRLAWAPASVVYHKEGGSIGTNADARPSDTAIYYLAVNLLRFSARRRPASLAAAMLRLGARSLRAVRQKDARGAALIRLAFSDWLSGRRRQGPIGPDTLARKAA
ncbi:glycosyltransferase family 2 protein [Caulobacter sp. BE254]|uniref:glycosyltransferase family 2 protein n=1 Tax=Caulobacter sp. BE254 TaxID=2817720 RepID=UPI0028545D71|nr:glycosyltransferase family 2 protein [Caulobacter sp. BE254]MDR7115041.1 GT2 family glycosyltransferase [Caulobacter sp. BE254]